MKIPYCIEDIAGYLAPMDKDRFPKWFHVMEHRSQGIFYRGQLLMQQDNWMVDQQPMSGHAEYLGNLVELWYER